MPFFEATLAIQHGKQHRQWVDVSDDRYYRYQSSFGTVTMRKRTAYPATFATCNASQLIVGYGDRDAALDILSRPLHAVPEETFIGREFLCVVIDTQGIHVQRDAICTLPLFVAEQHDRIVLCNDLARTCDLLDSNQLTVNAYTVVDDLLEIPLERDNTYFEQVSRLQERERWVWDGEYVHKQYAPDARLTALQHQREGNPYGFMQLLQAVYDEYWERYASTESVVGAELSGGMDSAIAPAYFAKTGRGIRTYTMLYPGNFGKSQRGKINDFTERFPVYNWVKPIDPQLDYPLSRFIQSGQWQPTFQRQEVYTEARAHIATQLASEGGTVIFTGTGGDELCDNVQFESYYATGPAAVKMLNTATPPPFLGPAFAGYQAQAELKAASSHRKAVPLVSATVTFASESANNIFLEHGIWPVAPLADPRLYYYCQSLPIRYRANRNIVRIYLRARGIPASIYHPAVNEHFGPFFIEGMTYALSLPEPQALFSQSILHKQGIVDIRELLRMTHQYSLPADTRQAALFAAYKIALIEGTMQSLGIASL